MEITYVLMKLSFMAIVTVTQAGVQLSNSTVSPRTTTNTPPVQKKCDVVKINGVNHESVVIKANLNSPYHLAFDFDTNYLFFSVTDLSGDDIFTPAYINLETNHSGTISGIEEGFATAIDFENQLVYLGGVDGLYTFDLDTNVTSHVNGSHHNILQMFYKDKLYYTDYYSETAYYYEDGETKIVEELKNTRVQYLGVDIDDNIFFKNTSGLYMYKRINGNYKRSYGKFIRLGDYYTINCFCADIGGKIYFSTDDGIFSITRHKIEKIVKLDEIYGMAIIGDNSFIYSDINTIYKLVPTKKTCNSNANFIRSILKL